MIRHMGWDYHQYRAQPKFFIDQLRQAMAAEAMAAKMSRKR